jgi:hypothetical protein
MLQEECHRNMAFTLYHADQMPLVRIKEVTTKALANGLTEITAIIENTKLTPTHSVMDRKQKITRPNWVSLQVEGVQVVLGQYGSDFLFRNATLQDRDPSKLQVPVIDGQSLVYVRWMVSGAGQGQVVLDTIKGGQAAADVAVGPAP